METTVSSNLKPNLSDKLFCRVRKEWVSALPEEKIRQGVLAQLIDILGFPASNIALEKNLNQMPHMGSIACKLPTRRADIICFAQNIHPQHVLYPLLLIECKAVPLTKRVINQVVSYNHYVKAYYLAIANQNEMQIGIFDKSSGEYLFEKGLPSYDLLLKRFKK